MNAVPVAIPRAEQTRVYITQHPNKILVGGMDWGTDQEVKDEMDEIFREFNPSDLYPAMVHIAGKGIFNFQASLYDHQFSHQIQIEGMEGQTLPVHALQRVLFENCLKKIDRFPPVALSTCVQQF